LHFAPELRPPYLRKLLEEQLEEGYEAWRANLSDDAALRAAEAGDIEPLRYRHPKLARFINLPTQLQGKRWTQPEKRRFPYPPATPEDGVYDFQVHAWREFTAAEKEEAKVRGRDDRIELAAAEVDIVRELWKKHYDGKYYRRQGQVTAEDIVAERWDVDSEEVAKRVKLRQGQDQDSTQHNHHVLAWRKAKRKAMRAAQAGLGTMPKRPMKRLKRNS